MSDELSRKTCDAAIVAQSLVELHKYVNRQNGRVEITLAGTDDRCVLISKRELEALERALEILSNTEDVRHIADKIADLVAAATSNDYAAV